MHPKLTQARAITRRTFFRQTGLSLGAMALGSLLERDGVAASGAVGGQATTARPLAPRAPVSDTVH